MSEVNKLQTKISNMFGKFVLVALSAVSCTSVALAQDYCDEAWSSNYTREELAKVENSIIDIAVSPHTDNVYVAHGQDNFLVIKRAGSVSKKNFNVGYSIYSVAVDNYILRVYIGSATKLQIYNEKTEIISLVQEIPYGIWKLFILKNNQELYGVKWSGDEVYRYEPTFTEETKINIHIEKTHLHRFVIDTERNYYYTTKENAVDLTKVMLKGRHSTITYNIGPFWALAVDNGGRVFGTSRKDRGVYHLKADISKPRLVATLDFDPNFMCFDRGNNAVFGTRDNKIVIVKFDIKCFHKLELPNTQTTTEINTIYFNNMTNEFRNMRRELEDTITKQNAQTFTFYNTLVTEIHSMRETLNNVTLELTKRLDENNLKLDARFGEIEKKTEQGVVSLIEKIYSRVWFNDSETEKLSEDRPFVNIGPLYVNSTIFS